MPAPLLTTTHLIEIVVLVLLALAVGAALITRWFVKRGLQSPWVVRLVNRATDKVVGVVKRPITIAVLDEVADVIQTGSYTKNVSDAIVENRRQIKDLVAEKVKHDPNVRLIGRLPGYDLLVNEVTETTLRVVVAMLADPRTDELVSDLLRNNLQQIKRAVRERQHENVVVDPPDPTAPNAR